MMPVIRRRVHALYRCFTHRHRTIVISPTEGTVFHPLKRGAPVDGHGVSPTFSCGWARCFTHRRHGVSPTGNHRKPNNGAGLQKRNARARFLTLRKAFNASGGGKSHSGRKKERPLAAYGAGRKPPRRGACRSPCPSLRLAGSTPSGDVVPHCLRHRLPLYFYSTGEGYREMAQNRFLMPRNRFPLPEPFACAVGQI